MRGRIWFLGGLGIGYVLGTRAGRQRFDQMVSTTRRLWESPTVQEAAGVVQAQANKLYDQGRQVVSEQVHKISGREGGSPEARVAETRTAEPGEDLGAADRRRQFPANAF